MKSENVLIMEHEDFVLFSSKNNRVKENVLRQVRGRRYDVVRIPEIFSNYMDYEVWDYVDPAVRTGGKMRAKIEFY